MSTAIVIFGVTGDLSKKKVLPALHDLCRKQPMAVIGVGRSLDEKQFTTFVEESLAGKKDAAFAKSVTYVRGDNADDATYLKLKDALKSAKNILFYMALPPDQFAVVATMLKKHGLTDETSGWRRAMVEKPLGSDEQSAKRINDELRKVFREDQLFRVDHYLGKELVQNILVLRLTNDFIQYVHNNEHVDHVQITVAEQGGIGGRGRYYDTAGALRDMVQSHMMQLLALVAMGVPKSDAADHIRDEKVKVVRALDVAQTELVRGQYQGYRDEQHAAKDSKTETFAALKTFVNTPLWKHVPFYLRTGKNLKKGFAEINIVLRTLPCTIYCDEKDVVPNRIIIRIQPRENISMQFNTKLPGRKGIKPVMMEFMHDAEGPTSPRAYEYLFEDALKGDATLFTRWDELEASWKFIDALHKKDASLHAYAPGTFGPKEADELMQKDMRKWIDD
jgi:glucose-6-phosphate 1-dehydrogenase